jgi:hypothetical protein
MVPCGFYETKKAWILLLVFIKLHKHRIQTTKSRIQTKSQSFENKFQAARTRRVSKSYEKKSVFSQVSSISNFQTISSKNSVEFPVKMPALFCTYLTTFTDAGQCSAVKWKKERDFFEVWIALRGTRSKCRTHWKRQNIPPTKYYIRKK